MPAVWTYPWTMTDEGIRSTCEDLSSRGCESISLSSHYHSVRTVCPRTPGQLYRRYGGGCHFRPEPDRLDDIEIDPPVVEIEGLDDPLAEIVPIARETGLEVSAWTVCLHNSRLGDLNPAYRIESAFGAAHDHALCPSHPAVREYFAAVVEAATARSATEVHLESIGFPSAFHGHGTEYGHDKRQVITSPSGVALLSQCFCNGCRVAASDHPVNLERAATRVRSLLAPALADPSAEPPSLDALVREDQQLWNLFDFRATVVERFVERIANAAGSTPLNYYVEESLGGADPAAMWRAGVRLDRLDGSLDRVTALCYLDDPAAASDRARSIARAVDATVDAGVTVDPTVVDNRTDFHAVVESLSSVIDGRISVYNHALMSEERLCWLKSAFE